MIPVKRVVTEHDLESWIPSQAHNDVLEFVERLQNAVIGLDNEALVPQSFASETVMRALDGVDALIDANPVKANDQVSRFGKGEFRDFYDAVVKELPSLLQALGTDHLDEICVYFNESWGDRTRIDYGLGHELNFICFLMCIDKMGMFRADDGPALVLRIFNKYMMIMRRLQRIYWLEPAGLHGVWGLDDYHFLPFLFGAAQLATHPHMKPKLIHNADLVDIYHSKYMYFECIHFINNIKTLPQSQETKLSLRWHSPMLDDISLARLWSKIKEGMVKMYKAEVLAKLPIIQHMMFGEMIECPANIGPSHGAVDDSCGHVHGRANVNTWGDCCGIKIPSAIAASESIRKSNQTSRKPIPFD